MATAEQVRAFFDKLGPLAVKVCQDRGYGNAQLWTCMCQAACESAYGTSSLMKNANAYFGIKANSSWVKAAKYGGRVYNSKTSECYDGKTYTQITACFRAYDSMYDSIRDYFDLMEATRYKKSLEAKSVHECITLIKNGGYATSPTYISTIDTIFQKNMAQITSYTVDGGQPIDKTSEVIDTTAKPTTRPVYKVGKVYVTQTELNVRTGPGIEYPRKGHSGLTADGRKHDVDKDGALDKGTRVSCLQISQQGNDFWIRTPSGWLAAYYAGNVYIGEK